MMPRILVKLFLIILLLSACDGNKDANNIVNIKVYTAGLGVSGERFPQEITDLWTILTVTGKKIIPVITLIRVDQQDEITLPKLDKETYDIKADQELVFKNEKKALNDLKIDANFSESKPSDFNLAKKRIADYKKQDNIFYLKSEFKNVTNYDKTANLLEAIKQKISQNKGTDQEYLVVYNVVDKAEKEAEEEAKEKETKIKEAQASKQTAEDAAVAASKAAAEAQTNLPRVTAAKDAAASALNEIKRKDAKLDCRQAKTDAKAIVAQIESFKQAAENAKNDADKAASDAQGNMQAVGQFLDTAMQAGIDKQSIEQATNGAALEATAAVENQKKAEAGLASVIENAGNAERAQQAPIADCKIPPPHPVESTPTQEFKPASKPIKHHRARQEDAQGAADPWKGVKKNIHDNEEIIKRTYLSE